MKFGNFHDEDRSYFGSLGLEDNSKSDNKVLFYAPGSTGPALYEGESTAWCLSRIGAQRWPMKFSAF